MAEGKPLNILRQPLELCLWLSRNGDFEMAEIYEMLPQGAGHLVQTGCWLHACERTMQAHGRTWSVIVVCARTLHGGRRQARG